MLARIFTLLLLACGANANTTFFQFTGTVTQVPIDDIFGDITFQDPISGSFSFDSSALDLVASPTTGSYDFTAPFGTDVQVGSHAFGAAGFLNISILNSFVDQYTVLAESSSGDLSLDLNLQDSTGTIFSSDALPLIAPSLAGFDQRDFHLVDQLTDGALQVDGQITSLGESSAPEPAAVGLVGTGLAALLVRSRRKNLETRFR
jgi:hypothetical protein